MYRYLLFAVTLLMACVPAMKAQDQVSFEITSGVNNPTVKAAMEKQAAKLLTAINRAQSANSDINYTGIDIDHLASQTIGMSWEQAHFRTEEDDILKFATTQKKKNGAIRGYQIRNIGVLMCPSDRASYDGDMRQEISIDFSPTGRIVDFNFTMPTHQYVEILKRGEQLQDLDERMQIIHWCEQFSKAYRDKNKRFMEDIFSDDALIITGKLVMQHAGKSDIGMSDNSKVEYVTQNKRQYLDRLFNIFDAQPYINVRFDEYRVVRHPTKPQYYGVTLTQKWATKSYCDLGKVFLVWDFINPDQPKIHVRTWSPMTEESFMLSDFKLP